MQISLLVNEIDSKIGSVFRPLLKSKNWKNGWKEVIRGEKIGDIVVTEEQVHF